MRNLLLSTLALGMFVSAPVLAQSASSATGTDSGTSASSATRTQAGETRPQTGETRTQTQTGESRSQTGDTSNQAGQVASPARQDQVRQAMQKAGFKNVTILDAAYLIQAETEDGDRVLMMLNPPTGPGTMSSDTATGGGTGNAARTGQNGSGASGATGGTPGQRN